MNLQNNQRVVGPGGGLSQHLLRCTRIAALSIESDNQNQHPTSKRAGFKREYKTGETKKKKKRFQRGVRDVEISPPRLFSSLAPGGSPEPARCRGHTFARTAGHRHEGAHHKRFPKGRSPAVPFCRTRWVLYCLWCGSSKEHRAPASTAIIILLCQPSIADTPTTKQRSRRYDYGPWWREEIG